MAGVLAGALAAPIRRRDDGRCADCEADDCWCERCTGALLGVTKVSGVLLVDPAVQLGGGVMLFKLAPLGSEASLNGRA